jgi:hypothetical protein
VAEVRTPRGKSLDQHAVSVRVEAISLFNGVPIGGKDFLCAGESADEHQQSGFGEMKVGEESPNETKGESGINKEIGLTFAGLNST